MVEHDLAKVGVASSSLVSRSIFKQLRFRAGLSESQIINSGYVIGTEMYVCISGNVPFV